MVVKQQEENVPGVTSASTTWEVLGIPWRSCGPASTNEGGPGSSTGHSGTKIPQLVQQGQAKKNKKNTRGASLFLPSMLNGQPGVFSCGPMISIPAI